MNTSPRSLRGPGLLAVAVGLLGLGLPAAAAAESFERVLAARPGGHLSIALDRGSVAIESHAAPEVRISAQALGVGARDVAFALGQRGDRMELRGRAAPWLGFLAAGPTVHVEVRIPEGFSAELRTGAGDLRIADLRGALAAHTGSGSIRIAQHTGPAILSTVAGNIDAARLEGPVDAYTSKGTLRLEHVDGAVTARSDGGRIRLLAVHGAVRVESFGHRVDLERIDGVLHAATHGGPLYAHWIGRPWGNVLTSGGAIDVRLPSDAAYEIDAASRGGVTVGHGLPFVALEGEDRLRVTVGNGGGALRLEAHGGPIRLGPSAHPLAGF